MMLTGANGHWAKTWAAMALALGTAGCVTAAQGDTGATDELARMLSGQSAVQGDALKQKVSETAAHPLGSKENPVRAQGPAGQRAYLARLRCANLKQPEFYRAGSAGMSPYNNIVDIYVVTCKDSKPAQSEIFIDMYHRGYSEIEAVPGFGIVGGRAG